MSGFASLSLKPAFLRALDERGLTSPTPIQAEGLPVALAGHDTIGLAETGSGKTLVLALTILERLVVDERALQALVLVPVRELARQVSDEIRTLARFIKDVKVATITGGGPIHVHERALQGSPHVVVATVGRARDLFARGALRFDRVRTVVLDEADRLLAMGFVDDVTALVAACPAARQTLLFSATLPPEVSALAARVMRAPVTVKVDEGGAPAAIVERFYAVARDDKLRALLCLLARADDDARALVFCHTKDDVRAVAAGLAARGVDVAAIHGDLEQRERDEALLSFAHFAKRVLVATDVAARGLDVEPPFDVVSFELPRDPDVHLHRIGRTGRAGRDGRAFHLVAPEERDRARAIFQRTGRTLLVEPLAVDDDAREIARAPMRTLALFAGKRDKMRKGDVLGALTGDVGLQSVHVGKIDVHATRTYVSIARAHADTAARGLRARGVKGRKIRVVALD